MQQRIPIFEERTLTAQLPVHPGCTLEYHISYPVFGQFPALSARYAAWAARYADYIRQTYLPALRGLPRGCLGECPHIEGRFEVSYAGQGLLSVCVEVWEDLGLYHTALGRRADLWHLPDGRPMGLKDLFGDPAAVQKEITACIAAEIAAAPEGRYFGGWQRRPRWFFLTERGLCVFYRPGDITALSGGIPTFLSPWEKLRPYAKIPL